MSLITIHLVWNTKYRDKVFIRDIKKCLTILIQVSRSEDVGILKDMMSKKYEICLLFTAHRVINK